MKKNNALVGIFIPCFNEEDNIFEVIEHVNKYLSNKKNFQFNFLIIVVDDGSTDKSFSLIRKSKAHYYYRNLVNSGLGSATRLGMEIVHFLGCDVFVKFDADQQHRVQDILPCITPIIDERAEVVYGSRFRGQIRYRMPIIRRVGNKIFTRLMSILTGWDITDAQTGLMCFGRRYLSIFEMPSSYNPPQQALLDAKFKGMRYLEVPVDFDKRNSGKSFISLRYIPKVISSLMKLFVIQNGYKILLTFSLISIFSFFIILLVDYSKFISGTSVNYVSHGFTLILLTITAIICGILGFFFFATINRKSRPRSRSNYMYFIEDALESNIR